MAKSVNAHARACCALEKERLMEELRACDYETASPEERHHCYRWAAVKSGRRAKACLISS